MDIFTSYMLFGWVGVLFLVLAYYFLIKKKLETNYVLYHLMNLFGAMGIFVSTFVTNSWPALVLTIIIIVISIFNIVSIFKNKPKYKDLRN